MKLTEQQQNCPYCHPGSELETRYDNGPWSGTELELEDVFGSRVHVGNDTWGEIDFDPCEATLTSCGEGIDPLVVDIDYCPFCGRPLRSVDN